MPYRNYLPACLLLLCLQLAAPAMHTLRQSADEPTNSSSEKASKGKYTICIDPGHSKQTVGASGKVLHLREYQVCWQMAGKLKAELEAKGDTVILTKDDENANVGNDERARIANRAHADLFIRLHCDLGGDNGIATFYPAAQGTIRGKMGPSEDVIAASRRCARAFHAALIRSLHGALHNRGVRTDAQTAVGGKLGGALEGSIYAEVPVILVEMCVLDNRKDEALIASEDGQNRLSSAMAAGVQAAVKMNRAAK